MDSKELTKALIAALPDTLEELTARLRQVVAQEPDPLVTRIERMRGAIADARTRIVQHWPDGPVRGSVIADDASYDTKYGEAPTVEVKYSFDTKCLQLARTFLLDLQEKTRPGDAGELAQAIQDVIEAHCRVIQERS